jgi:hypothetical protein
MSKFDAGTAIEALEFDFTAYGGSEGVIPEPSSGSVKTYFRSMKDLAKEARKFKGIADSLGNVDDLTDDEISERMASIEEAEEGADQLADMQKRALADLCSGTPSYEELGQLPYRVFQAFNRWLVSEINPKKEAPGSKH